MNDFVQHMPTEVVFGKEAESRTGEEAKRFGATKVLIVYGGGSAKKSGLIERIEKSLKDSGIAYSEYGGVKPNPLLGFAEEGVKKAVDFNADMIIAAGGGSVIDTAKGIAHGAANKGTDLWDIWTKKVPLTRSLPVGAVLTIPAAGSEMSDSAVLTNEKICKKAGINSDLNRCVFAVMNPELALTIPDYQLKCGITDIMMHTMERYFIPGIKCDLTDSIAEGLLRTVRDNGRMAIADRNDYDSMAEIMWASSISHNNITECGRGKDFSVHKIGMALSARYDYTHGATLSAVWGSWARFLYKDALQRFARYARNVWDINENDDENAAIAGIDATETFFKEIDMPVSLRELGCDPSDRDIKELASDATMNDTVKLTRIRPLGAKEIEEIYRMSRG